MLNKIIFSARLGNSATFVAIEETHCFPCKYHVNFCGRTLIMDNALFWRESLESAEEKALELMELHKKNHPEEY